MVVVTWGRDGAGGTRRDGLPSCPGLVGQHCVPRALAPGGWQRTLKGTLMGTVLWGRTEECVIQ